MAEVLDYRGPRADGEPPPGAGRASLTLGVISGAAPLVGGVLFLTALTQKGYNGIPFILGAIATIPIAAILSAIGLALAIRLRPIGAPRRRIVAARWTNGIVLAISLPGTLMTVAHCAIG
jgi:hypothetical protein